MLKLSRTIRNWPEPEFKTFLKKELQTLGAEKLPLAAGTTQGGYVGNEAISVTVNTFKQEGNTLVGSVGVFFTEIVINCGCGVDPMPVNAFCQLNIRMDMKTGIVDITPVTD